MWLEPLPKRAYRTTRHLPVEAPLVDVELERRNRQKGVKRKGEFNVETKLSELYLFVIPSFARHLSRLGRLT